MWCFLKFDWCFDKILFVVKNKISCIWIVYFIIFEIRGSMDWMVVVDIIFFFYLKMGVILVFFYFWGILVVKIVKLMRCIIGLVILSVVFFRVLVGILLSLVVFDVFSFYSFCLINVGFIFFRVIEFWLILGVSICGVEVWEKCLCEVLVIVVIYLLKLIVDRFLVLFVVFNFFGRI